MEPRKGVREIFFGSFWRSVFRNGFGRVLEGSGGRFWRIFKGSGGEFLVVFGRVLRKFFDVCGERFCIDLNRFANIFASYFLFL